MNEEVHKHYKVMVKSEYYNTKRKSAYGVKGLETAERKSIGNHDCVFHKKVDNEYRRFNVRHQLINLCVLVYLVEIVAQGP